MTPLDARRDRKGKRAKTPFLFYIAGLSLLVLLAACGGGDGLRVDLDKSNQAKLLRYYVGGYIGGTDPVAAGVLNEEGTRFYPEHLSAQLQDALADAGADGLLDWDEFVVFIEATYYEARSLPPTLDGLRALADWQEEDEAWFVMDVDGVMTAARRRIYVPTAALRSALEGYAEADDTIVYPEGTLIVGEHRVGEAVVETTVKRRRADGFWDFAVYDAEGRLVPATSTEPRALRAPVQCVGCHLGQRRFEPEESFPAPAPDGPFGPRGLYVTEAVRAATATHDLVPRFDEHTRRSDGVLGLYATLYTARLLADRDAGTLAPEDAALLERLGF